MPSGHDAEFLYQVPHIRAGLEHLIKNDEVFSKLGVVPETLPWRYAAPGMPSLIRIVIGQQVSTAAAVALWNKFQAQAGGVTPDEVLALDDDTLRACGLSRQKIGYVRGLAEAVRGGHMEPDGFHALDNDAVAAAITGLKGFGRWSADMYLMFSLARPDIWPAGDLGIQNGLQKYLGLATRPDEAQTREEGTRFAPHHTAASVLLWHMAATKDAGKTG